MNVIEHLGYVQIDTINVVERAHHHTLWTRVPGYAPGMLADLLARDRRVFEYWGHAASYLPMDDYRFYIPRMNSFPWNGWTKQVYERHKGIMPKVLERIQTEGPLGSADFKTSEKKRGTWWDWKPAKTALELLMWRGDLMVTGRRNFQRIYDLTERVLPSSVDITVPNKVEATRFQISRALSAHGIASKRDIRDYLRMGVSNTIPGVLDDMVSSGEVIKMEINELGGEDYYALTGEIEDGLRLRKRRPDIHFLSPFDNCVINRRRGERMFGFSYTLECYLPSARRKYGYFTLPILWGEDFVGRFDPKADRKNKVLVVKNMIFESGTTIEEDLIAALGHKLSAYARLNSCQKVVIERTEPKNVKTPLSRIILTWVA